MWSKKRWMGGLGALILLSIIWGIHPSVSSAAKPDDSVPDGYYYFSDKNVLTNGDNNKKDKNLFGDIIKEKQKAVVTEVEKLASSNFSNKTITGDLNNGDDTLWGTKLNNLYSNTKGTKITMKKGTKAYKIYIPRGKKDGKQVNKGIIEDSISAVEKYMNTVKEGAMAGTMASSFNIYSIYSEKQIPITDIVEWELNKDGKRTGYQQIKSGVSGIKYSLDTFYNPIFGKMDGSDIKGGEKNTQKYWEGKIKDVKIKHKDGAKVDITINSDYLSFVSGDSDLLNTLMKADSTKVSSANGVTSYKTKYSKKSYKPQSRVDGTMAVAVPNLFSKNGSSSKFQMNLADYKKLSNVRMSINLNYMYKVSGNNVKQMGDFSSYGIDPKGVMLFYTTVDNKGKYKKDGRKVGVVVPLWYKEVILDTSQATADVSDGGDGKYYTGRTVKLANDYSGKITLSGENKDLLNVSSKYSAKQGVAIRNFAFKKGADVSKIDAHSVIGTSVDKFQVSINFDINDDDEKANGFLIYRNNWYSDDTDLIKWVQSKEAKSLTNVNADKIYGLITGDFEVKKEQLGYDDWLRMQEIRKENDKSLTMSIASIARVTAIVFGIFLCIYGTLLVALYFLDITNTFMELSLLKLVTFNKLYPVTDKEDIGYIIEAEDGVRYVGMKDIIILFFIVVSIGLVFMACSPIFDFLVKVYNSVSSVVGGV